MRFPPSINFELHANLIFRLMHMISPEDCWNGMKGVFLNWMTFVVKEPVLKSKLSYHIHNSLRNLRRYMY
jgi:hypothetical protein